VDKDGKTIKTEEVEHGKSATAPEPPVVEGWTFAGWDKAFNVVKSDLTVQATYTQNTMGQNIITALLSQLKQQYQLTPGTFLISWFVRSTDDKGQAISNWAEGEVFELTINDPGQGVEDVESETDRVRKEMRNGLLYIIRNGRTYDANGKLIQ